MRTLVVGRTFDRQLDALELPLSRPTFVEDDDRSHWVCLKARPNASTGDAPKELAYSLPGSPGPQQLAPTSTPSKVSFVRSHVVLYLLFATLACDRFAGKGSSDPDELYNRAIACRDRINEERTLRESDIPCAVEPLSQALKTKPHNPRMLAARGESWIQLGRYVEALADYEVCLRVEPSSVDCADGRVSALSELGRFAEAAQHAEKALPSDASAYDWAKVADLHWLAGNVERAKAVAADFSKSHSSEQIASDPDGGSIFSFSAKLALFEGNADDAVKQAKKAYDHPRRTPRACELYALALELAGDRENAVAVAEMGLEVIADPSRLRGVLLRADHLKLEDGAPESCAPPKGAYASTTPRICQWATLKFRKDGDVSVSLTRTAKGCERTEEFVAHEQQFTTLVDVSADGVSGYRVQGYTGSLRGEDRFVTFDLQSPGRERLQFSELKPPKSCEFVPVVLNLRGQAIRHPAGE